MVQYRRKKRKESHLASDYINNAQFQANILAWYQSGKDEIPANVYEAVLQICGRLRTKDNFRNYSYIDEMEGFGIERCIKALREKKYDPIKYDNPFAYFTTVAFYEFIRIIKLEQRESFVKHISLVNLHQEFALDPNVDADAMGILSSTDVNWDLIEKFQPQKVVDPEVVLVEDESLVGDSIDDTAIKE